MIINLPKLGAVQFPDDMSPEQVQRASQLLADKYDFRIPKPDVGLGTIAKRGFMRGIGELGIAGGDILPAMVGSALGFEDYAKRQMDEASASRAELEHKYPTRFKSYQDIASPFEALEYAAETAGELAPTVATSLVPGGVFGAAGKTAATRAALAEATAAGVPTRAALAGVEKAAETGARRGMYGGVYLGSYAQNVPEIFEGIYRETGKFEAGIAGLTGGLSAALDSVLPAKVLDTLGGYGKLKLIEKLAKDSGAAPVAWKTIGLEAFKTAGAEGLTESAQEAIGVYAQQLAGSTKELLSPENIQQYKEAFVKGAVGGGIFGLPGGVAKYGVEKKDYRNTQEAQKALAEQEAAQQGITTPLQERIDALVSGRMETPITEAELADAFKYTKEELAVLQARMDESRPGSEAYAELDASIKEAQNKINALNDKKAQMSAFATATPDEQGLFQAQQPVDAETFKSLGINPKSKVAQALMGIDLNTPQGVNTFIKSIEAPAFMGKINEAAYDALVSGLNQQYVEQARAELKGVPSGKRIVKQPSGTSTGMVSQPGAGTAATGVETSERDGVVPTSQTAGEPITGEGGKPPSVDPASVDASWKMLQRAEQVQRDYEELLGVATSLYQVGITEPRELAAELGIEEYRAESLIRQIVKEFGQELPSYAEAKPVSRETQATEGETEIVEPEIPETAYVDNEADNTKVKELDRPDLPPMSKDARAYFGRADTETALRNIANDLVLQPTAYRNSKMKALPDEAYFASEKEAAMFRGQGGVHTKNAEKWVRENLTPENVAYLDKWIAQYQKENERSSRYHKKLTKAQEAKSALKQDLEETPTELTTAQELKNYGIKQKNRTRKEARKAAEQAIEEYGRFGEEYLSVTASDLDALLASPEIAALSTSLHPTVEQALKQDNLTRALGLFADSIDNPRLTRIAESLAKVLKDVKVVYGAEKSMYDPKTNTIYLPDNATDYDLIHEASHAGLSHIIANPSHPITRQLNKIFEQVKADVDGAYGAKNLQEFVAEIWSNEDFRTQLKEKRSEVPALSLWDKIIRALRQFFHMPVRTEPTLDQVDRLLDSIVSAPPVSRTGDTLYAQSLKDPTVAEHIFDMWGKIPQHQKVMSSEQAAKFIGTMQNAGISLRYGMQKFLNLSAVGQIGSKFFGQNSIKFADTINEMAGYRESLVEKLMPLDKRLQAYSAKPEFVKWTKMVHDHTREDINPEAPAGKYQNSEKEELYKQYRDEFNSLSDEGKKLYRDLFSAYKKLFNELQTSLYHNLVEVHKEGTDERKAALGAYEKVIGMIIAKGIDHYAPLYRQGSYWLEYKDKNGELVRELYNSDIERSVARKTLKAEGNTDFEEYVKMEGPAARRAPTGTIAAQIINIMKEGGADQNAIERFLELIVSTMPETSVLKSFNARKGTLGYEENAATAFRNVTNNMVGQLSRMRYADSLQRLLSGMEEKVGEMRGKDQEDAKAVANELEARYNFAMKPTIEAWARWASSGAFYYNLAGNISSAVVNLLQTPMVALPQMGGKYGFLKTSRALIDATRLYSGSQLKRTVTDINGQQVEENAMLSIENLVNSGKAPQYEALIKRLKELGFLQTSLARDALEASNMPGADPSTFKTMAEKTALYSSFLFHHAERMNREVTAVSAYELEMGRLKEKGVTGKEAEALAIAEAVRMVEYTHGAGHSESGPSIGHSSLGKVLTVFKRFGFTMYYMLFDTIRRSLPIPADATQEQRELAQAARRQLIGIYGMAGLFAGAKGLPLYWIAELAYNMLADDDDDKFDDVMRQYLGELLFKGPVNYFTNLGIADRVGWTDLIYRDQKGGKADAGALSQYLENILGAPYSLANNVYRGQQLINEGQMYRGIETMLPSALKNPMKAYRYATEGANTLRGDLVGDVNGYNAAMQVLGFAPADLLTKYEENAYIKRKEDATVGETKRLLKQYYVAMNMGDQDRMDALEDKLFALADKHPDLKITQDTINRSVKSRDTISRDMYQGIQINRKIRNELIDAAESIYD